MPSRFWVIDQEGHSKPCEKKKANKVVDFAMLLGTLSTGSKGNMLLAKKWKQWEMEYYQPVMDTTTWNITNRL